MKDKQVQTRLIMEHVSHNYGVVHVVNNLHLEVKPGEVVVLVGPSGCGKTTILNLLSGYIKPASGAVLKNGVIRTVYQQDGLFPWLTVSENISLGVRSLGDVDFRKQEMLELIQLIHLEGLKTIIRMSYRAACVSV